MSRESTPSGLSDVFVETVGDHNHVMTGSNNIVFRAAVARPNSFTPSEADLYDISLPPFPSLPNSEAVTLSLDTVNEPQSCDVEHNGEDTEPTARNDSQNTYCSAAKGNKRLHVRVHRNGSIVQVGETCIYVNVTFSKEQFERLEREGTIGVHLPTQEVQLITFTRLPRDEKIKSKWKLKLEHSFQHLEILIIQTLHSKCCDSDLESMSEAVNFIFKTFRAELVSLIVGCFAVEFIHADMESFYSMVQGILTLRTTVFQLLTAGISNEMIASVTDQDFTFSLVECSVNEEELDKRDIVNKALSGSTLLLRSRNKPTNVNGQEMNIIDKVTEALPSSPVAVPSRNKPEHQTQRNKCKENASHSQNTDGDEDLDHYSQKKGYTLKKVLELGLNPPHQDVQVLRVQPESTGSLRMSKGSPPTETQGLKTTVSATANLIDYSDSGWESQQKGQTTVGISAGASHISPSPPQRSLESDKPVCQVHSSPTVSNTTSTSMEDAKKFLKKIHVGLSDVLLQSVQESLIDETPSPPRSKGVDTVLCLDCSDSVAAWFHTVCSTALAFVDGIEEMAGRHNVEENIAVVAFGNGARVVQHLTNDYDRIRTAINSLHPGGRSPLFEALVVCAAAIQGKGGILSIRKAHTIKPRALVFTDGYGTNEVDSTGPDRKVSDSSLKIRLIRLIKEFCREGHSSVPNPVCWVPVGHAELSLLQSLAALGKGKMVKPENVTELCKYYILEQYIGQAAACLKLMGEDCINKVDAVSQALMSESSPEDLKYVQDKVRQKLTSGDTDTEPEADDFDYVVNREQEGLPPLGTRVSRGPDWKWDEQDRHGPGTIINHDKKDGWVYVLWDYGKKNAYRWGCDNFYDLKKTDEIPKCLDPGELIAIGINVVRGPDWKKEKEDGGTGDTGVVIRTRKDGKVKVRWNSNGFIGKYQFGTEVIISDVSHPKQISSPATGAQENRHVIDEDVKEDMHVLWEWQEHTNLWRLYDDRLQNTLEKSFKAKSKTVLISRDGQQYRISFSQKMERSVDNRGSAGRNVRRCELSEEEYQLKKATELSYCQS